MKISAIIILVGSLFSNNFVLNNFVFAETDSVNVGLSVSSTCPNAVCNLSGGEKESNCPQDCGCNNNGSCETVRGEDSSNCLSDCPVTTTSSVPPSVVLVTDIIPPIISKLAIGNITINSAEISWQTNEPASCNLSWGKTFEYGDGTVAESFLKIEHLVEISELTAGTNYRFSIICRDINQNKTESNGNSFDTMAISDIIPPANVSSFEATAGDSKIELKWQNPPDNDFDQVKIVRSDKFYPADPFDGVIVYSGNGENFIDTGLENNKPYYYSIFSYDKTGNYSSGAISATTPRLPGIIPPPISPIIVPAPEDVQKLTLNDFDFIQNDRKIRITDNNLIGILQGVPLTISIDYGKVPEALKTIMITLEQTATTQGQEDKYFSFLLKINKNKTAYEATIIPPKDIADYPLSVTVMDYKNQQMKSISGELVILQTASISSALPWQEKIRQELLFIFIVLVGIEVIIRIHKKIKSQISNLKITS
jgi:hypothetical protein